MLDQALDFIVSSADRTRPVFAVRPDALEMFLAARPPAQAAFLRQGGFCAKPQELVLLPGNDGVAGAVLGLGDDRSPNAFGGLAARLPEGEAWSLQPGDYDPGAAVLGYCLGAYSYRAFRTPERKPAHLLAPGQGQALSLAAAMWMVRDLINAPANVLGPAELADAAMGLAARHGARAERVTGAALDAQYPTVAAVGRGSARAPEVVIFHWSGSGAGEEARTVSLCGKGVCFDTGGYDLKPSAGMLRMKKDMGGAAIALGIARAIMEADLPIHLSVRIGCVENSVSGHAMRPLDVIRTRRGLNVEVGNTDAEGRLVLCDLLADASDARPDLLLDFATLTGAARVALGPDLPALFCNDEDFAAALLKAGEAAHDPLWRLPLWRGYRSWLNSPVADLNNVSTKPMAGAITAALFLERFVAAEVAWAHFDVYAWNDSTQPGRPEGGEAQLVRAVYTALIGLTALNAV